jgi:hypothetical protein
MKINRILLITLTLFLIGVACAPVPTAPPSIRAVYLVRGRGQLSPDDLQKHPEVLVTNSFDELKQHAQKPVALWIDKNAVRLLRAQEPTSGARWLDQAPQADYPIVLVGYSNTLFSFRENLTSSTWTELS